MPSRSSARKTPPPPVLRVTRYENVSSMLMTALAALVTAVGFLVMAWYASRPAKPFVGVPVELVEMTGGSEDGAIGETLRVDSPYEETPDATPAEVAADRTEVAETLNSVVGVADDAVTRSEEQFELGVQNAGKLGSAKGTGRRPLGSGPGSGGGFPREQRWMVQFSELQNLEEYARQLDFFRIEFGAIVNNEIVYVSKFSSATPAVRRAASGAEETRLYFTWKGGTRKEADLQLFRKAGIDVGTGMIFHFYPKDTENALAVLELAHGKRKVQEIRRTYFAVKSESGGQYGFVVARQILLR